MIPANAHGVDDGTTRTTRRETIAQPWGPEDAWPPSKKINHQPRTTAKDRKFHTSTLVLESAFLDTKKEQTFQGYLADVVSPGKLGLVGRWVSMLRHYCDADWGASTSANPMKTDGWAQSWFHSWESSISAVEMRFFFTRDCHVLLLLAVLQRVEYHDTRVVSINNELNLNLLLLRW